MITPTSGSITIPSQTADGIWISNITILAPNPKNNIQASITICPFNSETGILFTNQRKVITIPNVESASVTIPAINTAMGAIYEIVQQYVISKSLF